MIEEEEEYLNIKSVVETQSLDRRRDTMANYEQMKVDALERS